MAISTSTMNKCTKKIQSLNRVFVSQTFIERYVREMKKNLNRSTYMLSKHIHISIREHIEMEKIELITSTLYS